MPLNGMERTMLDTYVDASSEIVLADLETTDTFRCGKVRTARRRIAEGWYDREGFLDTVLAAILRDMAPQR